MEDTIVQIWEPALESGSAPKMVASGVVVGNGTQVLTVINYEDFTPGSLLVILPGQVESKATVEAIDPRTSATLLKLENARLPIMANTGDVQTIRPGNPVFINGWSYSNASELTFSKIPATVSNYQASLLSFNVVMSQEEILKGGRGVETPGSIVTDEKGNVIGLVGTFYKKLIPKVVPVGWIPPVISINDAIALLSPNVGKRPFMSGPIISTLIHQQGRKGYVSGILDSASNYEDMTVAVQELLKEIGEPLINDIAPEDYVKLTFRENVDGILLTLVWAQPVNLQNRNGQFQAKAKWVGIQWGRKEGAPNRLFYGNETYKIQGVFELHADITKLAKAVEP